LERPRCPPNPIHPPPPRPPRPRPYVWPNPRPPPAPAPPRPPSGFLFLLLPTPPRLRARPAALFLFVFFCCVVFCCLVFCFFCCVCCGTSRSGAKQTGKGARGNQPATRVRFFGLFFFFVVGGGGCMTGDCGALRSAPGFGAGRKGRFIPNRGHYIEHSRKFCSASVSNKNYIKYPHGSVMV
jgi:hypothetical protein